MAGVNKKKTDWILEKIQDMCVEELQSNIGRALDRVREEKPEKYLETVSGWMEYSVPKLSRVETDMQLSIPVTISLRPATEQDLLTEGQVINIDDVNEP